MKVLVHNLNQGEVLTNDVFSLTSRPIITRDTELTEEHIEVLKAFSINEVEVKTHKSAAKKQKDENMTYSTTNTAQNTDFHSLYKKAVIQYKKQFENWQAGTAVDLYQIRLEIVPLLEIALDKPKTILSLHHFSEAQDYIYHHAVSVGLISSFLAKKLSYSKGDIIQLGLAGALIDCGMSKIQPKIFNKRDNLTQSEYEEVKQHPILGYKMLKGVTGIKESVLLSVLQHHEREDGSGYPLGTKGSQLNQYSRIAAIADVFHAMTSERIYTTKQSPFKVLEQMQMDQFGKFDTKILNILVNELTAFSVGTKVELTNGHVGEIVFIDPQSHTRPMVKIDEVDEIIALTKRTDLYIETILT
ncbi:HD-GYP domain-containing protein [Bacillus sp. Marseille-Q3570]|uniref:HD-GYP domain-containing protein n=1 Tax=Bacillus sp. Marseille-Q3570 TaxID=2963522 RepID=UPI0021B7D376|nr:HD-GYP domain-containing protein [Bacillus sp. Marseille-Q3570]